MFWQEIKDTQEVNIIMVLWHFKLLGKCMKHRIDKFDPQTEDVISLVLISTNMRYSDRHQKGQSIRLQFYFFYTIKSIKGIHNAQCLGGLAILCNHCSNLQTSMQTSLNFNFAFFSFCFLPRFFEGFVGPMFLTLDFPYWYTTSYLKRLENLMANRRLV